MTLSHRIARIRIELDDTDPVVRRRVEAPLTTSLKGLHDLIQAVMPFEDSTSSTSSLAIRAMGFRIRNGIMFASR